MTEPLPGPDELIERAARTMRNRFSMQTPPTEEDFTNARALARDGLLAGPGLQAELERLRAQVEELTDFAGEQANARRESDRVRRLAAREAADLRDELATSRRETEDAREDAEMRAEDRTRADVERDLALWLHAEAVWQREQARDRFLDHYNGSSGQVDRIGELETALRERTAERDQLKARTAELEASVGHHAFKRGEAIAEREQLQARIDAATAELKKWDALATRESEWMPCRAALAALQGDQPTDDDRTPLADRARMWLEGQPSPVSREQATEAAFAPFAEEAAEFAELALPLANEAFAATEAATMPMWCEEHGQPARSCNYCDTTGEIDESTSPVSGAPEEQR